MGWKWIGENWGNIIGTLGFFLAIFVFLFPRIFEHQGTREEMAKWFSKKPWGKSYRDKLGGSLRWLEEKIGGEPIPLESDWQAQRKYYFRFAVFKWWLPFSFAYPLFLLLTEWVLSGQSGLANDLPPFPIWMRFIIAGGYVTLFVFTFYAVRKVSIKAVVVAVAVGFAVGFAVAGAVGFAVAVAGAGAVAVAGAVAGASAVAVAFAFAGAFVFAFVFVFAGVGESTHFGMYYFIFYIILPFLNCFFDFLSWGASRWLLRKISDNENIGKTLWHTFLDLGLACVCLFSLAFCLPFTLESLSEKLFFAEIDPIFSIKSYIDTAMEYPFSKGLGITGMLFTTFLPTAAHLFIALFALFLPIIPWRKSTAERLEKDNKDATASSNFMDMVRVGGILLAPPIIFGVMVGVPYWKWEEVRNVVDSFVGALYSTAIFAVELAS